MLRFAKSMTLVGLLITPLFSLAARFDPTEEYLKRTNLKCISAVIEEETAPTANDLGDTPSPKFLSLVAFGMQRNFKDTNGGSGAALESYQRKTIEFILANGYCKNDGAYGAINSGETKTPSGLAAIVRGDGAKKVNDGEDKSGFGPDQLKDAAKYFGFKNTGDIDKIFADGAWSSRTPKQRQENFKVATENPDGYRNGFPECLDQMSRTRQKAIFTNAEKYTALCKKLAERCEISDQFCAANTGTITAPQPAKGGSGLPASNNGTAR